MRNAQDGPKGRASHAAYLKATHKTWRTMPPEQKEEYHQRAAMEPPVLRLPQVSVDPYATHPQSPWSIGSSTYPCSSESIQQVVKDLMPHAKLWLREAYERCQVVTAPEAVANVIVENTRPQLDSNGLRRRRKRDRTCWEAHAGLCTPDPRASSIRAFYGHLVSAMKCFDIHPDRANGVSLFLFIDDSCPLPLIVYLFSYLCFIFSTSVAFGSIPWAIFLLICFFLYFRNIYNVPVAEMQAWASLLHII